MDFKLLRALSVRKEFSEEKLMYKKLFRVQTIY